MSAPSQVPSITAAETYARLTGEADARPVVIDVREPDEWAEGHIDGATHIPLGSLAAQLSAIPTDRDVVLVCHSGQRSGMATALLRRNGYARAVNMEGGMVAWERQRLPVAR